MSETTPFQPSREDGKSDRQILVDLATGNEAGTTYTYDDIIAALQSGLDTKVTKKRVYPAVAAANKTLLREEKRFLSVVRGVGYRLSKAEDHLPAAMNRKDSAVHQLQRGVELLKNTRMNELSDNERQLHEGQLMILSGLYGAVSDSQRRHDRTESVIDELKAQQSSAVSELKDRLDRLEADTSE